MVYCLYFYDHLSTFQDYDSDFEASDDSDSNSDTKSEPESEGGGFTTEEEEDEEGVITDDEIDILPTEGMMEPSNSTPYRTPPTLEKSNEEIKTNPTPAETISAAADVSDNEKSALQIRPKTSRSFVNFAKLREKHGVNQVG